MQWTQWVSTVDATDAVGAVYIVDTMECSGQHVNAMDTEWSGNAVE